MCCINLESIAAIPFSINLLTGGDIQIKTGAKHNVAVRVFLREQWAAFFIPLTP